MCLQKTGATSHGWFNLNAAVFTTHSSEFLRYSGFIDRCRSAHALIYEAVACASQLTHVLVEVANR